MNIINVVHYLNHLHVIHLSKQIFKARFRISEDLLYPVYTILVINGYSMY